MFLEKRRFIAFCIGITLLCICSVGYVCELYGGMDSVRGMAENVNGINIDGEDFTPFFKLGAGIVQGVNWFIILVSYIVLVLIENILFFLILRLVTIRKDTYISEKEISLTRKIIWSSLGVSFVLAIVLTKWDFVLTALSLFWQMPLCANLIYLLGLKSRYRGVGVRKKRGSIIKIRNIYITEC